MPTKNFIKRHWRILLPLLVYTPLVLYTSVIVYLNYNTLEHPVFWVLTILFLIIFGIIGIVFHNANLHREEELGQIREERKILTTKIETRNEFNIVTIIQLSLNQITEYYTINKGQAKSSFRFSIISIVIGLITIIGGIGFLYVGKSNITSTVLTSLAGVLLEFIGGAYFFMYKRSLEQVNLFYNQLIKIQDTMLAINIANGILDPIRKVDIEEKIVLSLLERSLK